MSTSGQGRSETGDSSPDVLGTEAAILTTAERLRSICPTISVGTLTADLMHLGDELALLEEAGVSMVHVDVMDGCFCPTLTVGAPYVKGLRTPLIKDVHLMMHEPLSRLEDYAAAGADVITVQLESAIHIHRLLQHLGCIEHISGPERGLVRGLALNPGTALEWLTAPLLDEIDLIVLLAVDPGWGGQVLSPVTYSRVAKVREIVATTGREILVAVDGGVTRDNIAPLARAGADIVVTGSAVFDGKAAATNAKFMLAAMQTAGAG